MSPPGFPTVPVPAVVSTRPSGSRRVVTWYSRATRVAATCRHVPVVREGCRPVRVLDRRGGGTPRAGGRVVQFRWEPGLEHLSCVEERRRRVLGRLRHRGRECPEATRRVPAFAGRRALRRRALTAAADQQAAVGQARQRRIPTLVVQ